MNIDYAVPGDVPHLQQPSDNSCWATVAAMMKSWKDGADYPISDVVAMAGPQFTTYFDGDEGLMSADKPEFVSSLGMIVETPQEYTVEGWLSLLQSSGALWVTANEGTDQQFAIHARILRGITGDGSPDATFLTLVDPATGEEVGESISVFTSKFESVARADLGVGVDLRPQVVHF